MWPSRIVTNKLVCVVYTTRLAYHHSGSTIDDGVEQATFHGWYSELSHGMILRNNGWFIDNARRPLSLYVQDNARPLVIGVLFKVITTFAIGSTGTSSNTIFCSNSVQHGGMDNIQTR